jgi:LysM repeat protein
MVSVKRVSERISAAACAGTLLAAVAACDGTRLSNEVPYTPPAPLALVALLDPSPDRLPGQLRQLEAVIQANANPDEAVVVMLLEPSFGSNYTVRSGDSLSKIAAAHSLSLDAIEAANPQLGPLSGRDWKLIHPGEHVMLPDGAAGAALLLATRAPSGPPHPMLIRLPAPPNNGTDFQRAQYKRTVDSDNATNASRIAAWQAAAAPAVQGWQNQVATQLEGKASASVTSPSPDPTIVATSIEAGLTTLEGLNGRRVLLLLGGGEDVPAQLAPQSMSHVNLVIANLTDSKASAAWAAAGAGAGAASVSALDTALTQLQLPQVVNNHLDQGGT